MGKKKAEVKPEPLGTDLAWPAELQVTPRRQAWHRRLSRLPGGLSIQEIAARLGQPYASVAFWAKKMGYPARALKRGRKSTIAWETLDWTLKNCELARQLGVSGERVRQIRLARNLPPTPRLSEEGRRFQQFVLSQGPRARDRSLKLLIADSGAKLAPATARLIVKGLNENHNGHRIGNDGAHAKESR